MALSQAGEGEEGGTGPGQPAQLIRVRMRIMIIFRIAIIMMIMMSIIIIKGLLTNLNHGSVDSRNEVNKVKNPWYSGISI